MRAALLALMLVCANAGAAPTSFIQLFAQACVDDFPYKPGQRVGTMVYHTALAGFVMTVVGGPEVEEYICQINMAGDPPKKHKRKKK